MTKTEALKAWRENAGLTQEDAAKAAGASLSGWRSWEAGRNSGPSTDVLRRLESQHPGLLELLSEVGPVPEAG